MTFLYCALYWCKQKSLQRVQALRSGITPSLADFLSIEDDYVHRLYFDGLPYMLFDDLALDCRQVFQMARSDLEPFGKHVFSIMSCDHILHVFLLTLSKTGSRMDIQ